MKTIGTFTSCAKFFYKCKNLIGRNATASRPLNLPPGSPVLLRSGQRTGCQVQSDPHHFSHSAARTTFAVVSRSGSPQVINAINAFPFSNASLILLMDILPSVAGNGCTVLVASAGNSNDNDFILISLSAPASLRKQPHVPIR